MTDGILLAEIQNDRFLNQYSCLIIDEAHERSLNNDFILGYLKQLLPRRRDLNLSLPPRPLMWNVFQTFPTMPRLLKSRVEPILLKCVIVP